MGRRKKEEKDRKKKFVGFWITESENEWIQNKANVSQYMRTKVLQELYGEKED